MGDGVGGRTFALIGGGEAFLGVTVPAPSGLHVVEGRDSAAPTAEDAF
jgi:hypothetical protein